MLRRAVATCGNADFGRLGLGRELTVVEIPKIITSLIDLHPVAVSAGGAHTATATRDGTVMTWGLNDHGQLGHATDEPAMFEPREVPLPEPAIALAAGHRHTLCLSDSGNIWAWGSNAHGQLGIGGDLERCAEPRLVAALKGSQIVGIAAGADHSLAVTSSGEVYSWGCGDSGRLGHGTPPALKLWGKSRDETKPRLVRALETQRVTQVAAGYMHSACITSEGQAFVFGSGRFYQLGRASDRDADAPIQIEGLPPVSSIACGGQHSLAATTDGRVAAWGANQNGCLGQGRKAQKLRTPVPVPGLQAEQVAAGWKHSAAVGPGGTLYTWGWGGSQGTALSLDAYGSGGGQLGLGNENDYWEPAKVLRVNMGAGGDLPQLAANGHSLWRALQVSCGLNHTAAIVEISNDVEL